MSLTANEMGDHIGADLLVRSGGESLSNSAIEAFVEQWAQLSAALHSQTAYLSAEWVRSWLNEFHADLRPSCLTIEGAGGQVLAVCLFTERAIRKGPFSLRRGFLNTDGEDAKDSVVVEHNQLLALPDAGQAAYAAFSRYAERSTIDELILKGGTPQAVEALQLALPHWHASVEWRDSPYVDLEVLRHGGSPYLSLLSRNTREQLRRAIRHYEGKGPLRIEVPKSLNASLEAFSDLCQLHTAHWQRRGKSGGFATPHRQSFHRQFITAGHANGRAQLLRVLCGDQTIGVLYNLVADGHVAFYQSGFLYDEDPRSRPGLVSHALAIQHYLEIGMREYDFLPSGPGEGRYKTSLANASRRLGTLTLARPGWRRESVAALRRLKSIIPAPLRRRS